MSTKRWIAVIAAVSLFLVSSAFTMFTTIFSTSFDDLFTASEAPFEERVVEKGDGTDKIAVLHLNGIIENTYSPPGIFQSAGYNHENFLKQLDFAAKDADVHGIIIRVNTPGGGVVESSEIHDSIVDIQEEFSKPVYISMGSMAASGGYYIAAPATKVYANSQTITGSIGVIMQSINVSELADELGISSEVIKSGPYKDIMSMTREMTDDERNILQEMIDESYEQFVDVIEAGRDFTRDEVYELADGRIYSGKQAYEANLIDGLGHFHEVIDAMQEDLDRGNMNVVEYEPNFGFSGLFSFAAKRMFTNELDLLGISDWLQTNQGQKMMYLYTN